MISGTRTVALSLAIAAPLALAACGEAKDGTAPPPRPVLTMVIPGAAGDGVAFAGTVEPRYRADLSFRVFGRIVARDVEVGDVVRKGQRVAALDPTALELAARAQRAALANAQATLTNASAVEERQRELRDRKVTAQAIFEAAEQARISAQAEVTRTTSNLTKAEEQLSYAELRSDFDGVVTAIGAEVGQVVSIGQPVITVARPDAREAVVDIPEASNISLAPGAAFDVALQLDERIRTAGVLREIAPEADSVTRSRRARITLSNPPETFRLGTTVTVRTKSAVEGPISVRLPASALLERDAAPRVFVVDETGSVSAVPVKVVSHSDGAVLVAGALKPGMRVVTAGTNSLNPGERVRIDEGTGR